jgi:glycosyltransferase involved in cell wall biosynthesis
MKDLGNTVYLYGGGNVTSAPCDEFISILTESEQYTYFGHKDNWFKNFFNIKWDNRLNYWRLFNSRTVQEIKKRINKKDIICIIGGNCQKPISDSLSDYITCEIGVGYEGVFSKYKVFESYAHMHYIAGLTKQSNGHFYDCVIPNYYDPLDFKVSIKKDDYFMFIGRMIHRKGIEIAYQVCKELNVPLKIAGQGVIEHSPGYIKTQDFKLEYDKLEYIGLLGVKDRSEYMSKAKALFVPTLYFGPFEGVSIEALFCGCPIITTPFGCFSENNEHGKTGYRCHTFEQFIWATENINNIDPAYCSMYANSKFSINVIKYKYQEYFEQLINLFEGGWYQKNNKRKKIEDY